MPAELRRRASPSDPVELQPCIGLIGLGEMGSMYAKRFSGAGWKRYGALLKAGFSTYYKSFVRILACDRPERFQLLEEKWKGNMSIIWCKEP